MIKRAFITLVFLSCLTSFQTVDRKTSADEIIGTYFYKSDCCGYASDKLFIKSKFQYKRVYSVDNFEISGTWTITGSWSLKGDTVYFTPTQIKHGNLSDCINPIDSITYKGWFCKPDTVIYMNNELWSYRASNNNKRYKEYSRK